MSNSNFLFENNEKVKSKITGFTGVINGRIDYLNETNSYCVVPLVDEDGKIVKGEWLPEGELIPVI